MKNKNDTSTKENNIEKNNRKKIRKEKVDKEGVSKKEIDYEYIELLAPCGSMESLIAAVQNGANAVYLGGEEFSARASANNFSREDLIKAISYAKPREVDIFVTVNTSIMESEVSSFVDYTDFLYKSGVDGIILSDIGMASILRKRYENMELHASTQIAAHSLSDVLELEKVGFDRVVVARELTVDEIGEICKNTKVDIEVFVHGALCVSYSGQCMMSSMLGDRSGNRGRCAQPCRQKYTLGRFDKIVSFENSIGSYFGKNKDYSDENSSNKDKDFSAGKFSNTPKFLLSTKDLSSIDNIDKVLKAGVKSLKLEGRMKKPQYVATVTKNYRRAIDLFLLGKTKDEKLPSKKELESIFSRGFTEGFLMDRRGIENMNFDSPKNMGMFLGEVIGFNSKRKKLKIRLKNMLSKGDGLSIGGGEVGRIFIGEEQVNLAGNNDVVEIDFLKNIPKGTKVYKTFDKNLDVESRSTFEGLVELNKIPISCKFDFEIGRTMILEIKRRNISVSLESDYIIERANNKKTGIDDVISKLSKTGKTPYEFVFDIDGSILEENSFLPASELNSLRRRAIEEYEKKILDFSNRIVAEDGLKNYNSKNVKSKDNIYGFSSYKDTESEYNRSKEIMINLKFNSNKDVNMFLDSLSKEELDYIDTIYTKDLSCYDNLNANLEEKGIKLSYALPGIIRNSNYEQLKKIMPNLEDITPILQEENLLIEKEGHKNTTSIMTSTWGGAFLSKKIGITPHLDTYFNIYNHYSAEYLALRYNPKIITVSQEINKYEVKKLISNSGFKGFEMIVYGHPRSMISEYCPMGVLTKNCKKDKRDEECDRSRYFLKDESDKVFRLSQDIFCRTEIYGNETIDLIDVMDEVLDTGVSYIRLDFTGEEPKLITAKVKEAIKNLRLTTSEKSSYISVEKINDGVIDKSNDKINYESIDKIKDKSNDKNSDQSVRFRGHFYKSVL